MKSTINLLLGCLLLPTLLFSQENIDSTTTSTTTFNKFFNNLTGSFESNAQWYLNDKETGQFEEEEHLRANSYLKLNYYFLSNFSAGVQVESYAPQALLNYDKELDREVGLAQYYINYRTNKVDATAGYFYEQFGSGLILRAWEDRALGLNNSIRGGRVKYTPFNFLEVTGLYGNQRRGFDVSNSDIMAFNAELNIGELIDSKFFDQFSMGLSYVNRKEDFESTSLDINKVAIPESVGAYSARLGLSFKDIYTNIEYITKEKDVRLNNIRPDKVSFSENKLFDGNALLFNLGYSAKGFGLNYTFRRLENMSFHSQREDRNLINNPTNRATLNYLPALTKQHDYTLANIYIYQAQPGLYVENYETPRVKAGEIGNQIDVFYKIKKGSLLGGKYGTKISANLAYWAALNVDVTDQDGMPYFSSDNLTYESDFLNFKNKIYSEFNLEINKKWTKNFSSIFTLIDLHYNSDYLVEANGAKVDAWIGIAEGTYKFGNGKSVRLEAQHLSTNDDARNWVGGTVEYFLNSKLGVYFNDSYNYEDSPFIENSKIHFFNMGGSFTKGATRVSLNYGRQRGGLICVGGVCRPVSKNTGVTLNLATSF
ncbi:DUF6029 family protein [Bizionia paragorgiae]|uniref:DUF5723 domain-containing protein n=1 Tax=Bizionia paragorgiae TaxID=283786 RepID=A0A1H4BL49_BIZPA|nr:DUF6029 family protein [Bizionia paragorgiae]SEA48827.1 hypothetical protein SAMN04487990_11523 [Bizionia paragorgiae]